MGCKLCKPDPGKLTSPDDACIQSALPPCNDGERRKNDQIEHEIEGDRQTEENKVKLLLLGAGESGKSTIFKQMRILYGSPRDEEDLRMYGVVVRSNIVEAIRKLCLLLRDLDLEQNIDTESIAATTTDREDASGVTPRQAYDEINTYLVENFHEPGPPPQDNNDWVGHSDRAGLTANRNSKMFLQHVEAIRVLWQCGTMREVWSKRAKANVIDAHNEYLQDLTRIASPDYRPTQQDILMSRVRTTQISMEKYHIDGIDFEMYDVGGQRGERKKWFHCFNDVDAVIFVAALSEYDQTLAEARRNNRMVEALELFKSVFAQRAFTDASIMLFLNKKDVFAEKIMYSDIAAQREFSDYPGPPKDFDLGVLYFIQKFKDCLMDDEINDSFIHVTCATDTNNMEFVLDSSRTIIMTDNLRKSGFLGSD